MRRLGDLLALPVRHGGKAPREGSLGASPGQRPQILLTPRPFVLAGLPHQRDDSARQVRRKVRTGRESTLEVTYLATHHDHPLPFGADRSLLAWIFTKADDSGTLRFSAIADYLDAFRLDRGGRGYAIFWQRFQRISNLALRLEERTRDHRSTQRLFLVPTSREPLSTDRANGLTAASSRSALAYYEFQLDERLWAALKDHRVPTPLALLQSFHRRPLAWDFAQLLLYRSFVAKAPSVIPWEALSHQLGSQDRYPRRLRQKLRRVLSEVKQRYPDCPAKILEGAGGLSISPWRPLRPARKDRG